MIGQIGAARARRSQQWRCACGRRNRGAGAATRQHWCATSRSRRIRGSRSWLDRAACPVHVPPQRRSLTPNSPRVLMRLSADSVRCGSCRTTSADVPKQSELVYYHVRARPHASTPSSRRSSVGVHALPRRRVERPPQPTARPVWVGRRGWAAGEPAPSRTSGSAGDVGERMRRAESGGESGGPPMCDASYCCVLLRFTWGVMFACPRYVVNARL